MQFTVTHAYPADTESVFSILTDRNYLLDKFAYTGAKNISILELGESGGQYIIKSRRDVPANPPAFAKKFVKPWNTVVGTDIWQDFGGKTKTGLFEIDIKGLPIAFSGKLRLEPTRSGCNYVIECDVRARIPLIGGKIEKLAEEDTRSNQARDSEFTRHYLERHQAGKAV